MFKYITPLIVLATIFGFIIIFVKALISKKLWPKTIFLVFALILLSIAGLCIVPIVEVNASNVEANVISVENINEYSYKVECDYIYKNKTYHTYLEAYFDEKPEIGSKIRVKVKKNKPNEVYGGDDFFNEGDGIAIALSIIGISIFGGAGLIIFIPTLISIIIFCATKNKRKYDLTVAK